MSSAARWGLVALLALAPAQTLGAQILSVPMDDKVSRPITVHAAAGYFFTQNRFDGPSGLTWYLGDAWQYRFGADIALGIGSFGAAATMATVPIQRGNSIASQGEIQLRQYLATFRSPEPRGFGQVVEIALGMSQWADYSGTDVLSAEEAKARNAVAVVLGYGFVIPLGKRFGVTVTQDYATVIGSKEGVPAGMRRSQEQYTTRIGLRWRVLGAGR